MNVQEKVDRFMKNEPLFDKLMNSDDLSYLDLNQKIRYTWSGMEKAFQDSLSTWGRQELGNWKIGLVIRARNEVVLYDNFLYRFDGQLPYTINGVNPTEDSGDWVNVGLVTDALLVENNLKDVKDKDEARRNIGAINLDDLPDLPDNLVKTDIQNNFSVRPKINGHDVLSVDMAGLGVGQTWQNVIASRAAGVTYTNNTGKPICISIESAQLQDNFLELYVDNQVIGMVATPNVTTYLQLFGIVPVGSTYRVQGSNQISWWNELR